jgi:uncharacterized membrane protein
MDLVPFLPWLVFAHVVGAFLFVVAHGVSAFVAFRVRGERDPARVAALLDLSGSALALAFVGLLVLLVAGIVIGIVKGSFGQGWIWLSVVLFVGIGLAMTPLGSQYYGRIRALVAPSSRGSDPGAPVGQVPVDGTELARLLDTRRPEALAVVGGGGFLVILWLMMFRPF